MGKTKHCTLRQPDNATKESWEEFLSIVTEELEAGHKVFLLAKRPIDSKNDTDLYEQDMWEAE